MRWKKLSLWWDEDCKEVGMRRDNMKLWMKTWDWNVTERRQNWYDMEIKRRKHEKKLRNDIQSRWYPGLGSIFKIQNISNCISLVTFYVMGGNEITVTSEKYWKDCFKFECHLFHLNITVNCNRQLVSTAIDFLTHPKLQFWSLVLYSLQNLQNCNNFNKIMILNFSYFV